MNSSHNWENVFEKMKTVVFFYTQSGQALNAARSICKPLENASNGISASVIYKQIVPLQTYPFPWSKDEFFDVFPETRLGIPPSGIEPIDFSDVGDADLVFVVGQSWFLSPSLPLQSFFTDEQVRKYLEGRQVIFVNGCRNMWLMTSRQIKSYLKDVHAHFVGHIVLQDQAQNLVSALTIVRWLMFGKKEGTRLIPDAGVSAEDLSGASRFGEIILHSWQNRDLAHLQEHLLASGAIQYKPSVMFIEKIGHRMFGLWSKFIRRKGDFGDVRRRTRTNLFFYYLIFVLFLISPFGQIVFFLTYPLHHIGRQKQIDCNI